MKVEKFDHGLVKYTIVVEPREFISVQRDYNDPVMFVVGDQCYDGTITSITEKNVVVDKKWRMKLEDFGLRNWELDET